MTCPRTAKPVKPKWYQAAAATSTMARGSGLSVGKRGRRGRRKRRRRYAEVGGGAAADEYDQPRCEYMQTPGENHLRMSWRGRQMAVITISRHPGSLGDTIARALAERLRYRLVERGELIRVAERIVGTDGAWDRAPELRERSP